MTGSVLVLRGFLAKSWPPDTTVRHRISGHSISTAYNAPAADMLQEAPQRGKWERGKRKKGAWKNGGKGAGAEARRERAQKRRLARARRQRKGRDAIP